MENKFYHSVYLEKDRCKGCIHCLKRCPTQAIRVRNGKAQIIKEFCIDCAECILHCPHQAKQAHRDHFEVIEQYDHTIALLDPSIYGQVNNLTDINILLTAFLHMGFDQVFEIEYACEYYSEVARSYVKEHSGTRPWINSTCPSVERLIRVRFPNLIHNLLPLIPPAEIPTDAALQQVVKKTGLS